MDTMFSDAKRWLKSFNKVLRCFYFSSAWRCVLLQWLPRIPCTHVNNLLLIKRAVYCKQPLWFYWLSFCAWLSSVSTGLPPAGCIHRHPFLIMPPCHVETIWVWQVLAQSWTPYTSIYSLHYCTISYYNHALLYLQTQDGLRIPNSWSLPEIDTGFTGAESIAW